MPGLRILTASSIFGYEDWQDYQAARADIDEAQDTVEQAYALVHSLDDAETEQREYVRTGDPAALRDCEDALFRKTSPPAAHLLLAACPLRAGEIVERYEEKAHVLVSRRHIERSWQGLWRQWFHCYAWPVTNNLNVMWRLPLVRKRYGDHVSDFVRGTWRNIGPTGNNGTARLRGRGPADVWQD